MTYKRPPWIWENGVAVITGGGGLIGRGMALTFAKRGMDIVLADLNIEKGGLGLLKNQTTGAAVVAEEVRGLGRRAIAVRTDVGDPASVANLAEAAFAAFGKVNVLCNNAGNSAVADFETLSLADWKRVLDVNLMGALHGIYAFLPRMIASGGPRHIVNTSSMSGVGLASLREKTATYVTAKFALVGLSESMAACLAKFQIGVSVLCPGTTVPDPTKPMELRSPSGDWYKDNMLGPLDVGEEVANSIEENRLHIFPSKAGRGEVEQRHAMLMRGFDQAAVRA